MEVELLSVIANELKTLGINYEYREFTKDLTYPYMVGEYSEDNYIFENGNTSGTFFLTVFHDGDDVELIALKESVKKHFRDFRKTSKNGGLWVSHTNSLFVESGTENIIKMEIYLDTNYWEGT